MYKPERQKKILALIQEMSSVSVMDLAKGGLKSEVQHQNLR